MIPQVTVLEQPSSDVIVKTREAMMYNTLATKHVERRYGYCDFIRAEAIIFTADGTPCPPQKCLQLYFEHGIQFFNIMPFPTRVF